MGRRVGLIVSHCCHGLTNIASTFRPILDSEGRVFAALAGQPKDANWALVHTGAAAAMDCVQEQISFQQKEQDHRRGMYPALSVGVSYGGGQKAVGNLVNSAPHSKALRSLLLDPNIKRIANFGNAAMQLIAPKLYAYYEDTVQALRLWNKKLEFNFSNNVFGAATFNFGPKVVTEPHTDRQNLPFGFCAITALGNYNPEEDGHLVLWDLGLVIEFPPGSTILIPSAILKHSNTAVQGSGRRLSFTQYSAGGLFRWVECGFQTQ
ncbi:hypothetical protein OBBRIDRAFT_566444, partial [Obba rivulosa]